MAKAKACPKCGNKLFMFDEEGKKCAKCGFLVESSAPVSPVASNRSIDATASPTEPCPMCGDLGNFSFTDENGKPWYDCRTCGNHYTPQVKKERIAPQNAASEPTEEPEEEDEEYGKALDGRTVYQIAKKCTIETRKWLTKRPGYVSGASGFYITSDLILTCSHCVLEGDAYGHGSDLVSTCKLEARFKDGEFFPITLLYYDVAHDLALVRASKHCATPAIIAKENAKTGEAIYSVGNTHDQGTCIIQGIISDELRVVDSREMMMNSANTVGGNSGCPTFNESGEVVGVHTAGSKRAVAMKYDAPVTRIRSFLQDAEKTLHIKINLK